MYHTQFLTEQGNPNNFNFNGNYSSTPLVAEVRSEPGWITVFHTIHILIRDAGSFSAEDYGNINNGLTNGVLYRISDDHGVIHNMCPFGGIKTNAQYNLLATKTELIAYGSGDNYYSVFCNFKDSGQPLILNGSKRFEAEFQDDLTPLIENIYIFTGQRAKDTKENRRVLNNMYMLDSDEF